MEQGSQDRNLPASERKLKKARDDGQVSRSQDLTHLGVLGAGALAVLSLSPILFEQLKLSMIQQLSFDADTVRRTGTMVQRLGDASIIGTAGCVAFAAIVMTAAILSAVASGGWVQSLKPLMPDFSRLNPLSGFANLFSKKKFVDTAKMMLMTGILFAIAVGFLKSGMQEMAAMLLQPSPAAIAQLMKWMVSGLGLMLLVILLAAMVDVPLQLFLHKDQMKMSHQEVKEEGKESDGNPQLKGKIRQRQREMAQRSSVGAVPKADFIVMNPTHYAVALRYVREEGDAPVVVAKGQDLVALKIREIARENDIPIFEDPPLARSMFAQVSVDSVIPSIFYKAVAELVHRVYASKAPKRRIR